MEIEDMDVEMRIAGAIEDLIEVTDHDVICRAMVDAARKWKLSTVTLRSAFDDFTAVYKACNYVNIHLRR